MKYLGHHFIFVYVVISHESMSTACSMYGMFPIKYLRHYFIFMYVVISHENMSIACSMYGMFVL